jgi:hypothetical protein
MVGLIGGCDPEASRRESRSVPEGIPKRPGGNPEASRRESPTGLLPCCPTIHPLTHGSEKISPHRTAGKSYLFDPFHFWFKPTKCPNFLSQESTPTAAEKRGVPSLP